MSYRTTQAYLRQATTLDLERTIWRLHGELKEAQRLKRNENPHAINCAGRIGGDCTCDFKSTFGK